MVGGGEIATSVRAWVGSDDNRSETGSLPMFQSLFTAALKEEVITGNLDDLDAKLSLILLALCEASSSSSSSEKLSSFRMAASYSKSRSLACSDFWDFEIESSLIPKVLWKHWLACWSRSCHPLGPRELERACIQTHFHV